MWIIFYWCIIISSASLFIPLVLSAKNNSKINERPVPRVVNGKPVKQGQFPYHISLKQPTDMKNIKYSTFCGGSLIKPNKVLTAAHCLYGPPTMYQAMCKGMMKGPVLRVFDDMLAVAGSFLQVSDFEEDDNEQWREIADYYHSPKYRYIYFDIAVLFVGEPFILNKYVNILPHAVKHMDYGVRECIVAGAGSTSLVSKRPTYVMWAPITTIDAKECDKIFESNEISMQKYICIETENTTILQGDSGGPLVCFDTGDPNEKDKGVIVGVACAGKLDSKRQTVFTRITSHLNTIQREKGLNFSSRMEMTYCLIFVSSLFEVLF